MKPAFLVLCTGNSARSILAEAILKHLGGNRLDAYSAGSKPVGRVHSHALSLLREKGIPTTGLASKGWETFADAQAPKLTAVITVCDAAAGEACPVFYGAPVKAHWGTPDPSSAAGNEAVIGRAFLNTYDTLYARCSALLALPFEAMPPDELQAALAKIGETVP